ncbi:ArsR/SmtB family transcription factor [Helcococcus ovis]|uniref:ArsR/SmtB family transcription factor n=2 Tax=Helcococcus ovis TaxID=72026 RepID=UPI0038B8807F
MKFNKKLQINYFNEALLLANYLFNNDESFDTEIFDENEKYVINKKQLDSEFNQLEEFLIKIRKKGRKLIKENSEFENLFYIYKEENNPNIMYMMIYSNLKTSILEYNNDELSKLFNKMFISNMESQGFNYEDNNMIKFIDEISIFNDKQKYAILKFMNNINGMFDRFIDFIEKLENIIKEYIKIIEYKLLDFDLDFDEIIKFKDFNIIKDTDVYKQIKEIDLKIFIQLNQLIAFSVEEKNKKILGTFFLGYIPLLKKMHLRDEQTEEDIYNKLCAISDEKRFELLNILSNGKKYGKELSDLLGISTGTVSHHITSLMENNLINSEIDGKKIYYTINKKSIESIIKYLQEIIER